MHAMIRSDVFRLVFHVFSARPGGRALAAVFAACAACAAPGADAPAAAGSAAKAAPVDALVARVNGEAVTIADVMREIQPAISSVRRRPDAPRDEEELFRAAFREALDGIVDRRLVVQKYWEGEQRLPPHAIDRTTAEILEDRYGGNIQNLLSDLATERMTYAEWRDKMQERLIVASMRHSFADGSAHVSAAEIAAAYEARKAEFARPARTKVRLASFSGDAAETAAAEAAAEAAKSGAAAAFARLAEGGTPGASVQDMGFVLPEEDLAPALAKAVTALADGAASAPVEIGGTWFLVFREESETSDVKPLSEVWDGLRSELLAEKRAAAFRNWIGHLRKEAVIEETLPF